jgi:hypothetical protein
MIAHWPQITIVCLWMVGLGYTAANSGKPRGNYSVGTSILALMIEATILWCGGFFG